MENQFVTPHPTSGFKALGHLPLGGEGLMPVASHRKWEGLMSVALLYKKRARKSGPGKNAVRYS